MWEDWSKIAYFEELAQASKTSIWHWLSYNIYLHITLKHYQTYSQANKAKFTTNPHLKTPNKIDI